MGVAGWLAISGLGRCVAELNIIWLERGLGRTT